MIDDNILDALNERARFALDNNRVVVKARPNGLSLYECRFVILGMPFLVGDGMEVKYFTEVQYLEKYLDEKVRRNAELHALEQLTQQARTLYGDDRVVVRKTRSGSFSLSHHEHDGRIGVSKFKTRHDDFNYVRKNSYVSRTCPQLPTPDSFSGLSAVREHLQDRARYNDEEKQRATAFSSLTSGARAACPNRHVAVVHAKRKEDGCKSILVFKDTTEHRNHPFDSPKELELLLDMHGQSELMEEMCSVKNGGSLVFSD